MVEHKLSPVRYDSVRAAKARYAQMLSPRIRAVITVVSIVLMVLALLLLLSDQPVGWLLLAVAIPLAMVLEWYAGELRDLRPSKAIDSYDDVLSGELLGKIRSSTTIGQFAEIVGRTNEALFFAVRYGVSPRILHDISEQADLSVTQILESAEVIRDNAAAPLITPGMVVCAFVQNFSAKDVLLSVSYTHLRRRRWTVLVK